MDTDSLAVQSIIAEHGALSAIMCLANVLIFDEVVLEAKQRGFTEPDPREDLSGKDVGRKLVCLAREIGYEISLDQIEIVNLVPEKLQNCTLDEFMDKIHLCDKDMSKCRNTLNL